MPVHGWAACCFRACGQQAHRGGRENHSPCGGHEREKERKAASVLHLKATLLWKKHDQKGQKTRVTEELESNSLPCAWAGGD